MLIAALQQCWPPFVLVVGLLLVGLLANRDGLFEIAAAGLERIPGSPLALFVACCLIVALTTAFLNLDTTAVFLTPVLIGVARRRSLAVEPFLYGALFMANASSLYLPGSNLTNLLVLSDHATSGTAFLERMLPAALAATVLTAIGVALAHRSALCGTPRLANAVERVDACEGEWDRARMAQSEEQNKDARAWLARADGRADTREWTLVRGDASAASAARFRHASFALLCVAVAAALMIITRRSSLPVLGVGFIGVTARAARRRVSLREVVDHLGVPALVGLFAVAVALGTAARAAGLPGHALASTSAPLTVALAAIGSVLVNNLPLAALLSAGHPAQPVALLIGLNLGPNLAVSGSLCALLWWRAAKGSGAQPSAFAVSRRGLLIAPPVIAATLAIALAFR